MTGLRRLGRRATESARVWRRNRMIERRMARLEDQAADAVVEPIRPAAAQPAPMLVVDHPPGLVNERHAVPAPDSPADRPNGGGSWIM